MKKLVIRQSSNRISLIPSEVYVDNILIKNVNIPYKMKTRGNNTLCIQFDEHIDFQTCKKLSKKLGLEILSFSNSRCVLSFPY